MPRIVILDDYADISRSCADWDSLPADCRIEVFTDNLVELAPLAARLKGADIVCIMRERTPFPTDLFGMLEGVKLIVTSGMRNRAVDMDAAKAAGITICGTDSPGHATSEHTWGLIHAVARNAPHDDRMMREGRWQTKMGVDLKGKTLGILGLGKQGGRVARVAPAFDMEMIAWSPNMTAETAASHGARLVSKEELFQTSDFLSIHVLLSARSRGLVGAAELKSMKPSARIVNTSRGPIIDQDALIQALTEGWIAGAAVDVFDEEPLPVDHPFRKLENLVMTPHTGYVTIETYRTFYREMVENIQAWLDGAPIRVLNP